ncbi:hypothetical protein GA0074695_5934 [Micromonospora viridifaciens]|uniref:Uncharacterized protein n=1 Tax=Micromonospora viridifaciens TaxID=1881 RepID=A0A1C4ZQF3_MICVI|nr:hypothetical protein [Micromonospora viridifaciens]SCF35139.1 hypothetical protein GA0074695_5934 [Micromonospora viridifaciens]
MNETRLHCSIILWNLAQSEQTVTSLREHLRDYAVDAYSQVPGLRQKIWVSSTGPEGETWGAVYLWDNEESAYGRPPAASRVGELIGYRPTRREYFSVEAAVEGVSAVGALMAGLGMAYQDPTAEPLTRPREYVPGGEAPPIPMRGNGPGPLS